MGYVEDVTNADQKAVLWRLSTQGQIDFLQDDVASVTGTTGGPLNATLGAAESALAKGNRTAACNQLRAFINQVNAEIGSGRLDPDVGADWIARAQNAIDQLCP
ncbi:MAG: FIMAH domain-containing protein [Acidimicrobiales bacterium]